jgi:hypothetical protein
MSLLPKQFPKQLPTATATTPPPTQAHESPLPWPGGKPWRTLVINLKLGLRAAFFLPLQVRLIHATWAQLILLIGLGLAIQFGWDFAHLGLSGELALNAAPGALFTLPVVLLASWALARLARRPEQTLVLAVAFCATTIPIDTSLLLLSAVLDNKYVNAQVPNWGALSAYAGILWFALAAGFAAIRLFNLASWRTPCALLLGLLLVGGPLSQVYTDRSLWVRPYEDNVNAAERAQNQVLDTEEIFYLQPQLLEHALAAIKPGNARAINLYFVGAAGYSDQDVFMKEVEYVNNLFKKRFGTAERAVMLINNPKTAAVLPIASTTSLRRTFNRIGEVMNPDKDILFLYLTSHGSKDHKFTLDFGSMRFNELDPDVLRQLLDESGIKRRVVVISACYSGGFIDALQDDNTLVISASAPDKTSFGCSNEADFTYFGRAYFAEALRKTDSFIDAFELAKPLIAAREKKEDFEGSDPRISAGPQIKSALADFIRQREAARARVKTANAGHPRLAPTAE